MADETITVVYERLGEFAGKTYYHETLLYTNASGERSIANCGPTQDGPKDLSGQISQLASGASGSTTSWGSLGCTAGSVTDPRIIDTFPNMAQLIDPTNPSTVVATGADLSEQWGKITQAEQEITSQNFSYSPFTLNSNSAANTALTAAGITPPPDTDMSGPHWAPAADNVLPTSLTPPVDNSQVNFMIGAAGDTTVTITYKDRSGNTTDSIIIKTSADGNNDSVSLDTNGDGLFDQVETINATAAGTVEDVRNIDANGSVTSETVTATAPDANSGSFPDPLFNAMLDQLSSQSQTAFAENARVSGINLANAETIGVTADITGGVLQDETITVTTTNNDKSIVRDLNGDGVTDQTETINTSAGTVDDLKNLDSAGNIQSESITTTAPDGNAIISRDLNGDGVTDQVETITTNADGKVDDVKNFDFSSNLQNETITTDDGQGNVQTDNFNADATKTSDSWQHEDGSHGNAAFNSDGSSSGIAYDGNDNYSTFTQSVDGSSTTDYYDANSQLIGNGTYDAETGESKGISYASGGSSSAYDNFFSADGSYNDYSYSSDGSYSRSSYDAQTGDTTRASQDAYGNTFTDEKTFNADGSAEEKGLYGYSDGTYLNLDGFTFTDGSYQYNFSSSDGSSNAISFDVTTGESKETITNADGTQSGYDNIVSADGSYSDYSFSSDGSSFYKSFDVTTEESKQTITNADGSQSGYDNIFSADGSYNDYSYLADGSSDAISLDLTTGESKETITTPNGSQSGYDNIASADGSYNEYSYSSDGSSDRRTFDVTTGESTRISYSADGSYTGYDDIASADGSYSNYSFWSDGSYYRSSYDALSGDSTLSTYQTATGYVQIDDITFNPDGSSEHKGVNTNAGVYTNFDVISLGDGSYQQITSSSDGGYGIASYNGATGESQGYSYDPSRKYEYQIEESGNGYSFNGSADGNYKHYASAGSYFTQSKDLYNQVVKDGYQVILDNILTNTTTEDITYNNWGFPGGSIEDKVSLTDVEGNYTNFDIITQSDGSYHAAESRVLSGEPYYYGWDFDSTALTLIKERYYYTTVYPTNASGEITGPGELEARYQRNTYHEDANGNLVFDQDSNVDEPAGAIPTVPPAPNFDFTGLNQFNQAQVANNNLAQWSTMNSLLDAHLAGSDSEALGGDLANQPGTSGTLAGIGLNPAQTVLGSPQFGSQPQTLQPLSTLQEGTAKLS